MAGAPVAGLATMITTATWTSMLRTTWTLKQDAWVNRAVRPTARTGELPCFVVPWAWRVAGILFFTITAMGRSATSPSGQVSIRIITTDWGLCGVTIIRMAAWMFTLPTIRLPVHSITTTVTGRSLTLGPKPVLLIAGRAWSKLEWVPTLQTTTTTVGGIW